MSEDKLVEAIKRAVGAVEKASVPDDLRQEAFRIAWQSIADDAVPRGSASDTVSVGEVLADTGQWESLRTRLPGTTAAMLYDVFALQEDGSFEVKVPMSKLPPAKTEGTRAVALLVCAGRQKIVEEWTPGDAIIEASKYFGKFDSANNASAMTDGDKWWQIDGKGKSRRYKLRQAGWEAAANLIVGMFEG